MRHLSSSWLLAAAATKATNCFDCPLNWHLKAPEVAYLLDMADTSVCFVGAFVLLEQSVEARKVAPTAPRPES